MARSFYLGKVSGTGGRLDLPADRLTTHAVVVGMTGSGKTGLLMDLLEEAAFAGIPALVLDPKGDLSNRLLVFPEGRPEDFAPFTGEARAAETASRWRQAAQGAGYGEEDLRRLEATRVTLFTPGAETRPLNVLERFAPPPLEADRPGAALAAVAALFTLLGLDGDPATSPEGLLLCHQLLDLWASGTVPTLEDLVRSVLSPTVRRIGVLDLDAV
ncbi:MAG: helicase HerA-like domain-containing protein, partial [Acidobacteriota bacterium]